MEDIFEELAARISDTEEAEESRPQPRDDEAEEVNDDGTNRRVVKPPKRIVSRPRPKLDPARLLGPRGIFVLTSTFEGVKFKGKGHELDDLNRILSRLQHWAHRLFPKMKFQDCIEKIEDLGSKKEIMTNMHKIRNGMIDLPEASQDNVIDDDDPRAPSPRDDPFDQLVSVVPPPTQQATLTDEQRARMMRNRLLAEERRQARRLAREKEMEAQRQSTGNPDPIDLDEADHADRQTSELDTPSTEMDRGATNASIPSTSVTCSGTGFGKVLNAAECNEEMEEGFSNCLINEPPASAVDINDTGAS
ncbi:Replication Fork Protection Component Swi3 [Nesidiocoris tenuis]|uniref:TIMELESS-interacting protein n=1 Tax=Nesidiocoris tenuis TaxID=355587 RepID=A0ABN7A6B8_9HEMI|nr:Replication Fork Protection Component Swi3 [Nesidiocoris tenuis]